MRVHYFQHVPFEGLGSIAGWLGARGMAVTGTRFHESALLPELSDIDWLIVMGGPMSVHDEALHPWLREEKAFIAAAIGAGKAVLGICLGAQLIAEVLGASVFGNAEKEIGWHPVSAVSIAPDHPAFRFPPDPLVFHWHGETFELPAGSVHLARSAGCENQAFQFGANVVALQFHLETTLDSAQALVANCRTDLQPGQHVQAEEAILSAPREQYEAANSLMDRVLSYLANRCRGDDCPATDFRGRPRHSAGV